MLWKSSKDCFSPNQYLIGDKAYPLSRHLVTPYKRTKNRPLSQEQLNYNAYVSKHKTQVQRTLEMLKQRFQLLKDGFRILIPKDQNKRQEKLSFVSRISVVLCGLHNMLKDFDEADRPSFTIDAEDESESEEEDGDEDYVSNPEETHISDLPSHQCLEEGERLRTGICADVHLQKDRLFST